MLRLPRVSAAGWKGRCQLSLMMHDRERESLLLPPRRSQQRTSQRNPHRVAAARLHERCELQVAFLLQSLPFPKPQRVQRACGAAALVEEPLVTHFRRHPSR